MKRNGDQRVVVTGLGLVTPLATRLEENWEALMARRLGIGPITRFDVSDFATRIGGEVRDFDPLDWIEKRDVTKMDLFIQYAIAAAELAMRQIAIRYGARGINPTTTSACFSGSHAAGEAYRMIRHGYLDAAIAGGSEAALTALGVGGFIAMRALSTRNGGPEAANRPFDAERDGFVMSEGAAALILEERQAALGGGANILAEVAGYGADSDADHMTSPSPGARAQRAGCSWAWRTATSIPGKLTISTRTALRRRRAISPRPKPSG